MGNKNIPTSNSFKSREQNRIPVRQPVKSRSKPDTGLSKFIHLFFVQDFQAVKDDFIENQLVPGIKDLIQRAVDAILWENGKSYSRAKSRSNNHTDYSGVSTEKAKSKNQGVRQTVDYAKPASRARTEGIIFRTRPEAEEILHRLDDIMATYDQVTVADFLQECGKSCETPDNYIGWTDLRAAYISRTRDGFTIVMPDYERLRK